MWKISGYIGRLLFGLKKVEQQKPAADRDGRIAQIERVPVVAADVKIQKIGHLSPHDPVEHIAHRATEDQSQPADPQPVEPVRVPKRSEEHTFELQSHSFISYA